MARIQNVYYPRSPLYHRCLCNDADNRSNHMAARIHPPLDCRPLVACLLLVEAYPWTDIRVRLQLK